MVKLVPAIMFSSPTLTCEVGVLIPIWKVPGLAFSCSTSSLIELTGMLMFADQRGRHERDQRDRHEILERIVGELAVEERIHHQRAVDRHQQRVAVGRRLRHRLGADDGVRSRPVVDDDLLAQILAHLLADEPAEEIGGPAGRERDHQRDLPRRIGLRRRRAKQKQQSKRRRQPRSSESNFHVSRSRCRPHYASRWRMSRPSSGIGGSGAKRRLEPLDAAPQHRLVAVDHRLAECALDIGDRLDLRGVGAAQENAVGVRPVVLARELGPFPRRDGGEFERLEAERHVLDHGKAGRLQIVDHAWLLL